MAQQDSDLTRTDSTVDYNDILALINNPISCGFLHSYCESEFNAENMKYMIAIAEFRDFFRIDRVAWYKSYEEIDRELKETPEEDICHDWPSAYLSDGAVKEKIESIHSRFIHDRAPNQICVSSAVLHRTEDRISKVNLYGPQTFEETLLDPLKTLKRDILPRFLRSAYFTEMVRRMSAIAHLPAASDLVLPIPPTRLKLDSLDELPTTRRFHLKEVVDNRHLYQNFLTYTQKCFCSENLICYRMVTLFEECIRANDPYIDIAWEIYRFFVADGSAYEISIEFAKRKAIMLDLASPKSDTFEFVKKSSLNMLRTIFTSYKNTDEYDGLVSLLRSKCQGFNTALQLCIPH